jgi:hypothetical protein
MKSNPILDEIRAIRDAHAKEFNYDLDAIFADHLRYQKELKAEGWKFVKSTKPRPRTKKSAA